MATQQISSFNGGQTIFEYDYDGDPPRLRRFRTRNNSQSTAKLTAWDQGSNVLAAQYETPPGETIEVIVSNGRQLVVNADGDYELRYQVRCEVS